MITDVRAPIRIALKVLALTIVLFICFAVSGPIVAPPDAAPAPESSGPVALTLLAVCFLSAIVFTHIILRSRWSGARLMAAVFLVFYGVMTFMSQIETAVFVTRLPEGMLPRLFLAGIVIAAPFSVLSVLILGKWKPAASETERITRLIMPVSEWAWKLGVIAVVYVILYFTFGYFIAWQDPAVREYYGGIDSGGFFPHMGTVFATTPWLFPFQVMRALLWVAIALPVVRMLKGSWQETALVLGVLFGVFFTLPLLLPNPYMPEAVRMAHLAETASSNFLFGLFVGWLLTRRQPLRGVHELEQGYGS